MNFPDLSNAIATELEAGLAGFEPEQARPLARPISPWLATALLQKSIRRGRNGLAKSAAAILLDTAPEKLFRRLSIIAVEDVGLGDLDAVYLTIAAMAQRKRLFPRFGGWRVTSFVIDRLCSAAKCRATDDLTEIVHFDRTWDGERIELAGKSTRELFALVAGTEPFEVRAIALTYAMGTGTPAGWSRLPARRGSPKGVFDFMDETGFPHTLVAICREAYRQTGETIAAYLPLVHAEFDPRVASVVPDDLPPEVIIDDIPGWAIDKFTREGRRALSAFLSRDYPTAKWLKAHVPARDRLEALGGALFHVESGLVDRRLVWPLGRRLQQTANERSFPLSTDEAQHFLALLRADLPLLDKERGHVL